MHAQPTCSYPVCGQTLHEHQGMTLFPKAGAETVFLQHVKAIWCVLPPGKGVKVP